MADLQRGAEYFFAGASVGADRAAAEATSQFEVIERIFATPALHRDRPSFPAFDYFTDSERAPAAADDILITAKASMSHGTMEPELGGGRGAVGLGLGPSLGAAKTHGLFEAIERHLRSSIWYRGLCIRPVSDDCHLSTRFVLRRYCVDGQSVPFCLSVVVSTRSGESVLYVGSAVRHTSASAAEKADDEALMMLDSYLAGRDGVANTQAARRRFLELSGRGARAARRYLESRVRSVVYYPDQRWHCEREIAEAVLGSSPDIRYCELLRRDGLFLVRVFAPALTWERRERALHPDWPVPDPYC